MTSKYAANHANAAQLDVAANVAHAANPSDAAQAFLAGAAIFSFEHVFASDSDGRRLRDFEKLVEENVFGGC